jgi:hypothetical protein
MTNEEVINIYIELMPTDEESFDSALADMWHESYWDDRVDCISQAEYEETCLIHKQQREQQVIKLIQSSIKRGKYNGS